MSTGSQTPAQEAFPGTSTVKGCPSTEGKEPSALDTYARALFDNRRAPEAVAQQKKTIALVVDEDMKANLQKTLEEYEAKLREGTKSEAK